MARYKEGLYPTQSCGCPRHRPFSTMVLSTSGSLTRLRCDTPVIFSPNVSSVYSISLHPMLGNLCVLGSSAVETVGTGTALGF